MLPFLRYVQRRGWLSAEVWAFDFSGESDLLQVRHLVWMPSVLYSGTYFCLRMGLKISGVLLYWNLHGINEQKNKQPPNELKCVFIFKCVTLCCTTNTNVAKCDSFSFHFKLKEILSSVIYDCLECNALKRNFNDYWIEKCLMRYLKVSMFDFPFLIFRVNWKRNTLTTKKRGARQLLFLSDITLSAISRF